MKVLVVGSGGREHALVRRLSRSPGAEVYAYPGRAGFKDDCTVLGGDDISPKAILNTASRLHADLTLIGPEGPLVLGAADLLREQGMPVFGPSQAAAALEGSKHFTKVILTEAGVPTADYRSVRTMEEFESALISIGLPAAIKADGLAAGKGVVLVRNEGEARSCATRFLVDRELGAAGRHLIYEEYLEGEELSLFAIVSGENYALFPAARDYKRIGDGGTGPNTGGMGAIVPVPGISGGTIESYGRLVFPPVLAELSRRDIPYRGILYAGLMLTDNGPKVLEFNCRLGDPEAQALLPLVNEDLLSRMYEAATGGWIEGPVSVKRGASVCLVLAAEGYPSAPVKGETLPGLDLVPAEGVDVFHAGTARAGENWIAAGGRVLNVAAGGEDIEDARARAYEAAGRYRFPGSQIRKDIGMPGVRG